MRISKKLTLILGVVCVAAILLPTPGFATTTVKDCPTEPAQNVPITSGETYNGTNCDLYTTGDVDSFTFNANAGDTWDMVLGVATGDTVNICLTLYSPTATVLYSGCTNVGFGGYSVPAVVQLATAGTYTIVVQESADATAGYSLSLERINPPPADATALTLSKNLAGEIATPTAQEAYTFYGVTTGTYEIAASLVSGSTENVCFNVYSNGSSVLSAGPPCTNVGFGGYSISADVTPSVNGEYVVLLYADGDDTTVSYNLEVSCLLGTCTTPPPKCQILDSASYSNGTLTMNFTLYAPTTVTWNGWLTTGNTIQQLWSQSQTETQGTKATQTASVSPSGVAGVLSTFTTPSTGIKCSSWVEVNTGKP